MTIGKLYYKSTSVLDDRLKEECGIFGIYNHKDAAALTALGLHALQHRGQEACGINSLTEKFLFCQKKGFGRR
jgi:amidophosphoribosyltransferase